MIRIRPATPEDAAAVAQLLKELGYPVGADTAAERVRRLQATGCDPVYVAVDHERLLGLVALHWAPMLHLGKPAARITALVVSAEARRHKIGHVLIDHAVAAARQAGCERVELTSANDRAEAHAFYRAQGFEQSSLRFHRLLGS
ncbi:MAG TPA: GNAT family N-acetyltransferase [Stellaceae bacterium]